MRKSVADGAAGAAKPVATVAPKGERWSTVDYAKMDRKRTQMQENSRARLAEVDKG